MAQHHATFQNIQYVQHTHIYGTHCSNFHEVMILVRFVWLVNCLQAGLHKAYVGMLPVCVMFQRNRRLCHCQYTTVYCKGEILYFYPRVDAEVYFCNTSLFDIFLVLWHNDLTVTWFRKHVVGAEKVSFVVIKCRENACSQLMLYLHF